MVAGRLPRTGENYLMIWILSAYLGGGIMTFVYLCIHVRRQRETADD